MAPPVDVFQNRDCLQRGTSAGFPALNAPRAVRFRKQNPCRTSPPHHVPGVNLGHTALLGRRRGRPNGMMAQAISMVQGFAPQRCRSSIAKNAVRVQVTPTSLNARQIGA